VKGAAIMFIRSCNSASNSVHENTNSFFITVICMFYQCIGGTTSISNSASHKVLFSIASDSDSWLVFDPLHVTANQVPACARILLTRNCITRQLKISAPLDFTSTIEVLTAASCPILFVNILTA
jgi:hypothetical protein